MSISTGDDEALKLAQAERQNYIDTVQAILAFAALVVHDGKATRPGAAFGIGRRMTPPAPDEGAPLPEVTPDLVAQRSATYGVIGEVKATLARDPSRWDRHVAQLRKYAGGLAGWWTADATIPQYDTAILVNITYSVPFRERLEQLQAADPAAEWPSTAVVEYTRQDQLTAKIFYRLHWGSIADADFSYELRQGRNVPIGRVLLSFGAVKFYDDPPPLPYLLEELWLNVLPSLVRDQDYEPELKAIPIPVTVKQITEELQRAHGSRRLEIDDRSAEFPTQTAVRCALDELTRLGLAARGGDEGNYTVQFKHQKGDVFTWFVKLLAKKPGKSPAGDAPGQLSLFRDGGQDDA